MPKRALVVLGLLVGVAVLTGLGSDRSGQGEQASGSQCKVSVDADVLNVRSGPELNADIVDKLRQNEQVDAKAEVRGGFRKLGAGRWASDEYLQPSFGTNCG
ncbi:MAG: SH3 domain-containing protein [Pseudonocardiaceae bacterium]|nr:SH3 domain-containing protein [Pseudonocardiaceae bacterium]